jgi:hypothetical protein
MWPPDVSCPMQVLAHGILDRWISAYLLARKRYQRPLDSENSTQFRDR